MVYTEQEDTGCVSNFAPARESTICGRKLLYRTLFTFTLGYQVNFLFEEQTEAYMRYVEGAPEKKNTPDAKKPAESHASHESRLAGVIVKITVAAQFLTYTGFQRFSC